MPVVVVVVVVVVVGGGVCVVNDEMLQSKGCFFWGCMYARMHITR